VSKLGAWLGKIFARPSWRRTVVLSEEIASDVIITLVVMSGIFVTHAFAKLLGIDILHIAFGFTFGHIFTLLHLANLVANGVFAILHLIHAHRSHHD
jgi:hypothetical protein